MAVNIQLVALALIILLSFPPTLHSIGGLQASVKGQNLPKLFQEGESYADVLKKAKDVFDVIKKIGESPQPDDKPLISNTEAESVGFYITFGVGNSTQLITAQVSISSAITFLENYEPSSTAQCCTANLSCSRTNCNGNYSVLADTFTFQNGNLSNVPYVYDRGNLKQYSTGFASFSRSPYSLLSSTAQSQMFSYYFSNSLSNFTIGAVPSTTALQFTKLVTNPNNPHLYNVELTQISIGGTFYKFDPTTNSSKVILDTVFTTILLETGVYAKVKTEIMKLGKPFNDTDSGLELCFSEKPDLARPGFVLPLGPFFIIWSSNGTKKDNYVVSINNKAAECAAIYKSEGTSVIGVMPQINREMVFDLSSSEPRLYFSQYASSGSSTVPSVIIILIWSLSALAYFYVAV